MITISANAARGGRETKNHKLCTMLVSSLILTVVSLLTVFVATG